MNISHLVVPDIELVTMLEQMIVIRAFDSRLPDLYTQGLVRGSTHAAIGQEAVAVGACSALRADDYITSTHRGHGHVIAKGGDVKRMMAELLGRVSGYCRGKGGSMHIADFSIGMLGANGIVGGGFGLAAGAALSIQVRGTDQIALCFFGEGAINQGIFHEAANMASIWRLPLVLLCENNQFAMSGRVSRMTSVSDLARRADAYGFPGQSVDGMDAVAVRAAVEEVATRARGGGGPSLVVASCYRFAGHFSGDVMQYRTDEEAAPWLERDPIRLLATRLISAGLITESGIRDLQESAEARLDEAVAYAKASPLPDPEEAWADVFS
jgi:TPP-dependent pyruvate/acetoin dehydrogenase alpha subunit